MALGIYTSSYSTDLPPLESELGRSVEFLHAFGDASNLAANTFTLKQYPTRKFLVSLPLIPTGGDMAEYAAGARDAEYATAAANLAKQAAQVHSVRIGWEFNMQGVYPWNAGGAGSNQTPANYAAAFARYAAALKAAIPGLLICWCPLWDKPEPSAWYPGDVAVDIIGTDVYLYRQFHPNNWQAVLTAPSGVVWQANFAAARGKLCAIPEWGTDYEPSPLIADMAEWCAEQGYAYQAYWDSNSGIASKLDSTKPTNLAAYLTAFSLA